MPIIVLTSIVTFLFGVEFLHEEVRVEIWILAIFLLILTAVSIWLLEEQKKSWSNFMGKIGIEEKREEKREGGR